jgi:hypothetical protein
MLLTEGFTELGPLHLVSGASGDEVGPPCFGITVVLQTMSSDSWYSWGARTWTWRCRANGWPPAAHPLQQRLVVGWPKTPNKSLVLDLKHCWQRGLNCWSWSRGGATTRFVQPLIHGWMQWLEPRSGEAKTAPEVEQSWHLYSHHECSPCCHIIQT